MNIGAKVALYGIAGVGVLCVALSLIVSRQMKEFANVAGEQIETQINSDLSHIAELTYDMVESHSATPSNRWSTTCARLSRARTAWRKAT